MMQKTVCSILFLVSAALLGASCAQFHQREPTLDPVLNDPLTDSRSIFDYLGFLSNSEAVKQEPELAVESDDNFEAGDFDHKEKEGKGDNEPDNLPGKVKIDQFDIKKEDLLEKPLEEGKHEVSKGNGKGVGHHSAGGKPQDGHPPLLLHPDIPAIYAKFLIDTQKPLYKWQLEHNSASPTPIEHFDPTDIRFTVNNIPHEVAKFVLGHLRANLGKEPLNLEECKQRLIHLSYFPEMNFHLFLNGKLIAIVEKPRAV